jgi:hypothetical protein
MTRLFLKKLLACVKPPLISAEMYSDPLRRSMARICERADRGYREDMLALIADKTLTDVQRMKGFHKARSRQDATLKKLDPLRERYDREVWIPLLKETGVLRKVPAKPGKSRT